MPKGVRRRYLALKLVSDSFVSREDLMNAIWDAVVQLFGEYGASQTDLALIKYSCERNYAILRCSHRALEMVKASIVCITEIEGKPVAVHVKRVSGTLKALLKKVQFSDSSLSGGKDWK